MGAASRELRETQFYNHMELDSAHPNKQEPDFPEPPGRDTICHHPRIAGAQGLGEPHLQAQGSKDRKMLGGTGAELA